MHRLIACFTLFVLSACTHSPLPEVFGVTMVEETTCIGQGGRIVEGPDGAFCALG